jgi:hypothetical protein
MLIPYHRQILAEALSEQFSPQALAAIAKANAKQDYLRGQIGHDEFHFDNNAFEESFAYIAENRAQVRAALQRGDAQAAWAAFGRLSHTAQDFYAHSNYVPLWLAKFEGKSAPPAAEIVHDDEEILRSPALRSGKLYYPLELFSYLPLIGGFVLSRLPKDSHAWMNIDSPKRGEFFAYTFAAAVKITRDELNKIAETLNENEKTLFFGQNALHTKRAIPPL